MGPRPSPGPPIQPGSNLSHRSGEGTAVLPTPAVDGAEEASEKAREGAAPFAPCSSPGLSPGPEGTETHSSVSLSCPHSTPVTDVHLGTSAGFRGGRILQEENKWQLQRLKPKGLFHGLIPGPRKGHPHNPTLQFWHIPPIKRGCSRVTLRLPQEMQMSREQRKQSECPHRAALT